MRAPFTFTLCLVFLTARSLAQSPEQMSLRLESVGSSGSTHEVAVVGSWTDAEVWGWSWGVCHDPGLLSFALCNPGCANPCQQSCSCALCPSDLAAPGPDGQALGFHVVKIHPNGVTQAVATDLSLAWSLGPRQRFEMLRLRYELYAQSASLSFCETLGSPPVDVLFTASLPGDVNARTVRPGQQEELTLYNTSGHYFSLTAADVSIPASVTIGEPVEISWEVKNTGTIPSPGSWFDAVYLSRDAAWDPGDAVIARVPHDGALGSGEALGGHTLRHAFGASDQGNSYVLVSAGGGAFAASAAFQVDWRVSELNVNGAPLSGAFTRDVRLAYFRFTVEDAVVADEARAVRITLDDAADVGASRLFAAHERIPTRQAYDAASSRQLTPDSSLIIPSVQPGTYYVLAAMESLGGRTQSAYQVGAEYLSAISLTGLSPARAGNRGQVTVRAAGAHFTRDTVLRLRSADGSAVIEPFWTELASAGALHAAFDLSGAAPGAYDAAAATEVALFALDESSGELTSEKVVIEEKTLGRAFTVEEGGGPQVRAEITVPSAARFGQVLSLAVEVRNTGFNDVPLPVVVIESPSGSPLSLDGAFTAASRPALQLIPLGKTRRAAMAPGESWQLTLYARAGPSRSSFRVSRLDEAEGILDWGALEAMYRDEGPPGQWEAAWPRFLAMVGGSWPTYLERLRAAAVVQGAGTSGTYVTVSSLLAVLLAEAKAEEEAVEGLAAPEEESPAGAGGGGICPQTQEHCVECASSAAELADFRNAGGWIAFGWRLLLWDAAPLCLETFLRNVGGALPEFGPSTAISKKTLADRKTQDWVTALKSTILAVLKRRDLSAVACGGAWHRFPLSELQLTQALLERTNLNFNAWTQETGQVWGGLEAGDLACYGLQPPRVLVDESFFEVRKSCDPRNCCRRIDVGVSLDFRFEDVYDFCRGGEGAGIERDVVRKMRQLETCGAAKEVRISARLHSKLIDSFNCSAAQDCEEPEPPTPGEDPPPDDSGDTPTVRSRDPNEKIGPAGITSRRYVRRSDLLLYTINFENQPDASAAALEVRITDRLDANLDLRTVELIEVGVGSFRYLLPAEATEHSGRAELEAWTRDEAGIWRRGPGRLHLAIETSLDYETREITWTLAAVDAATGVWPEDPFAGLVPPNCAFEDPACDCRRPSREIDSACKDGRGEGFVRFLVRAAADAPGGAVIRNQAAIVFDYNEPIVTEAVTNTIIDAPLFRRGDGNNDGQLDISDPVAVLGFLYLGKPEELACEDAADADDNGLLQLTDAVRLLGHLFLGSAPLPEPFAECGADESSDALGCASFLPCSAE